MAKLHELLAAERTPTAAWNALHADTLKKFANPGHFFEGHSRSLKMIDDSDSARAQEAAAREEKAVVTTVYDTLEYALDVWVQSEDLQYQKNATNRTATADVMWDGGPLLTGLPVDQLLGLESRLAGIRQLLVAMPTLDASRKWVDDPGYGRHVKIAAMADETTKTEKKVYGIELSPATDKHPAQVQAATRDDVVGRFTTQRRSGACTALQKAESLKRVDALLVAVKQARMRANETEAVSGKIAGRLAALLLEPLLLTE